MGSRNNPVRGTQNGYPSNPHGTEDYPPYPPPDYPWNDLNSNTPRVSSINQSSSSNPGSSSYGPVVNTASTSSGDERNPTIGNRPGPGLYDNNVPTIRSLPPFIPQPDYDYIQQLNSSNSFKNEKQRRSCKKTKILKFIVIATILVGIGILVAMALSPNLFPTTDNPDVNKGISDLRTSVQMMRANQMQQNETINVVVNTINQDVEEYKYINDSIKDLQNRTQSLLTRMERYIADLKEQFLGYIYQRFAGCCGNRVNITVGLCVDDCTNVDDGDYQSCRTCHGYITCSNQLIFRRNCSDSFLVWDDILKRCEWNSDTCR
ncbi:uncharacterized protein LOC125647711 [Ostrea edulis]|uniref:uncharacterized protein LOC125647711 n=1 Tax=Ostrea edulis TaxID=37623 RepID=UPI0024AF7BC2|nr:uncharacterized protein LOC125647711 [Ostrea edulis]